MAHLRNFERDMTWVGEPANTAAGSSTAFGLVTAAGDGVLYTKHGYLQSAQATLAGTAGNYFSWGIGMQWPNAGPVPYRVKGFAMAPTALWGFGWATTVSASTVVTFPRFLGVGQVLDDLWCVRELSGWVAQNLVFFCSVPANYGPHTCGFTVQSMLSKPDQFSTAIS